MRNGLDGGIDRYVTRVPVVEQWHANDRTSPPPLRGTSPITHIGAVATVNKTGGSSIFLYNWVSGRNRPTVCSLSSIPNLMQDSLFVPPSVSDTCLSF